MKNFIITALSFLIILTLFFKLLEWIALVLLNWNPYVSVILIVVSMLLAIISLPSKSNARSKIASSLDDEISDTLFIEIINKLINKTVSEQKLADILMVSIPTIKRWKEGKNLPANRVRISIKNTLEIIERAEKILENKKC